MPETALTYLQQGQRGVFAEVYFPRRVTAQGTIFKALEEGFHAIKVKEYLTTYAEFLLKEFPQHRQLIVPEWYNLPQHKGEYLPSKI